MAAPATPVLTIYYLRHGENEANVGGVFTFRKIDHDLTARGWEQSREVAEHLAGQPLGDGPVFCSPLKRARQTGGAIALRLDKPLQVIEELHELNVGDLEGQSGSEAVAYWWSVLRDWESGKRATRFAGGENHFELTKRLRTGLEKLRVAAGTGPVVLAAHAGLLRIGFRDLALPVPPVDLAIPNCSVTRLELGAPGAPFRFHYWARADFLSQNTSAEKP